MMFLDCPAYLDHDGAARCGLPAEVTCRFTMRSTGGPLESARIRCPAGHYFCGAIESLTWDRNDTHDPGGAAVTSRAGRDSLQGSHDGGGSPSGDVPAKPERDARRPNTAPAYYLGHPATLWITAMRPHRRPTVPRYPMTVAVSGGNPIPGSSVSSTVDSQVTSTGHGCAPHPTDAGTARRGQPGDRAQIAEFRADHRRICHASATAQADLALGPEPAVVALRKRLSGM
jgi:hypothetical protein